VWSLRTIEPYLSSFFLSLSSLLLDLCWWPCHTDYNVALTSTLFFDPYFGREPLYYFCHSIHCPPGKQPAVSLTFMKSLKKRTAVAPVRLVHQPVIQNNPQPHRIILTANDSNISVDSPPLATSSCITLDHPVHAQPPPVNIYLCCFVNPSSYLQYGHEVRVLGFMVEELVMSYKERRQLFCYIWYMPRTAKDLDTLNETFW